MPSVRVLDQIKSVWYEVKKPATVVLTFDRSGSMSGEKIGQAINGAIEFVEEMDRKDWIAWKPFSTDVDTGVQGLISDIGEELVTAIRSDAKADGETALYDAIAHAYQTLQKQRVRFGDTVRYGIVVLSDGKDTTSRITLAELEEILTPREGDTAGIQIHTIGVDANADDQVLGKIATITNGRMWKVTDPSTIPAVARRIHKYW